eukprot:gene26003-11694_t
MQSFECIGYPAAPRGLPVDVGVANPLLARGALDQEQVVRMEAKEDGQGTVLLSVHPPVGGPAPKLDICLVVDRSGSMDGAANPNGGEDVKLFTKMDLAKRGMEVIAPNPNPNPNPNLRSGSMDSAANANSGEDVKLFTNMDLAKPGMEVIAPNPKPNPNPNLRSGSMDGAANPNGGEDVKLFTKMDLAKRGMEVIARALGPEDTLSMFSFDHVVEQVLDRSTMNQKGLKNALDAIGKLHPRGSTALWDGLSKALSYMEVDTPTWDDSTRTAVVVLLTDGLPSSSPAEGEISALKRYLVTGQPQCGEGKEHRAPRTPCKLITMGFGYDVNSKLLADIADTHGDGFGNDFAFIPDGSMLLTNFVNMMANLKSTCARETVLHIIPNTGASGATPDKIPVDLMNAMDAGFKGMALNTDDDTNPKRDTSSTACTDLPSMVSVMGDVPWKPLTSKGDGAGAPATGIMINLGDLQYGQAKQVVLQGLAGSRKTPADPAALPPVHDVGHVTQQLHWKSDEWSGALGISSICFASRIAALDHEAAQKAVKDAARATMTLQGGPLLQGTEPHPILEDMLGQVSEGMQDKSAWGRWGQHYVRSLISGHKAQACNNFKDPGVLAYGAQYTHNLRDAFNIMCDSLPVPTPSIQPCNGTSAPRTTPSVWTASFNNCRSGCFGAGGRVLMADGSTKATQDIRAGDLLWSPEPCIACNKAGPGALKADAAIKAGAIEAFADNQADAGARKAGTVQADAANQAVASGALVQCVITYSAVATVKLPGSGLVITPWHPVRSPAGTWHFPADLLLDPAPMLPDSAPLVPDLSTQVVYNYVLASGHIASVDGVECVTLGHGFQEDVVRHPFFGSQAVVEELQMLPGWSDGFIQMDSAEGGCRVDATTGLVCSLSSNNCELAA